MHQLPLTVKLCESQIHVNSDEHKTTTIAELLVDLKSILMQEECQVNLGTYNEAITNHQVDMQLIPKHHWIPAVTSSWIMASKL